MKNREYILTIAMLGLIVCAQAQVSGVPEKVILKNVPVEFSFYVSNTDIVERPVTITLSAPTPHYFLEKPGRLLPGETKKVVVRMLAGQNEGDESVYTASVLVEVGLERAEKKFFIVFEPQDSCSQSIVPTGTRTSADGTQVFAKFEVSNPTSKNITATVSEVKNIPSGWKANVPTSVVIEAHGKNTIEVSLVPNESFSQNAVFTFLCGNEIVKKSVFLEFEEKNDVANPSGFFGLSGIFGNDKESIFLNAVLAAIASVLLLMFVSRLAGITLGKQSPSTGKKSFSESLAGFIGRQEKGKASLEEIKSLVEKEVKR